MDIGFVLCKWNGKLPEVCHRDLSLWTAGGGLEIIACCVCVLRWMQCNHVTAGYSCCSKGWLGGECVCVEMDAV